MKVKDLLFRESPDNNKDRLLYSAYFDDSRITVLNRMTGYGDGIRDIETGFTDDEGTFWLASGMFDIRDYPEIEINKAIMLIKDNSNTCVELKILDNNKDK